MSTRDHPNVAVPPPLIYFAFLGLGWALGRYGVQIGLPPSDEMGFGLTTEVRRGVALVLILGGLLLDGMAAGVFRRLGTAVEPWKPSTVLATGGLYRFSRNPIYLGFAITYVGLAVGMDSPITLLLLVPCLLVVDRFVIQKEETYLAAKFGAEYDAYRNRVRRWLWSTERPDDLSALAIEELDAACALSWAEMKRITPWGDTYDGLTAGGLEVEVERRYIWAHQPEGSIAIEVEVRLPGTRQGAEARAVIEPSR